MAFGTDASNRMGSLQAIGGTFYNKTIDQSLRFNDDDSAYLSRTPSSAGSLTTWTWSGWVKRGNLAAGMPARGTIFGSSVTLFGFFNPTSNAAADNFGVYLTDGEDDRFMTNRVFRDTSSWYHFVVVLDTTNSTADDRLRIYVNGVRETSFSRADAITQNRTAGINAAAEHAIGRQSPAASQYFDGYMAEIHFVDGSSLGPEYFGENKNGVWIPKRVSGVTYGTNGFHMDFVGDASGAAALFDGVGDNIRWSDASAFDIGTSDDFCLEMFVKGDFESNYSYGFGEYATAGPHFLFQLGNSGNIYGYYGNGAANGFDASAYLTTTDYHHIAYVRESGTYRFYIDGVERYSVGTGGTTAFDVSQFNVGDASPTSGAPHFNGSVSNLRFTIGSARYSGGTTFTVPTSTLTNDSSNVKLLAFTTSDITADGSTGNISGSITEGDPVALSYGPLGGFPLSNDKSGNGNNFDLSGISDSDVVPDSPTNNWCKNNSAMRANITHSEGNLKMVGVGGNFDNMAGTFLFDVEDADGWYWEGYVNSGGVELRFGISKPQNIYFNQSDPTYNFAHSSDGISYSGNGLAGSGGSYSSYGDTFTTGDVIGIAVKAGAIYFYKNGTIQNSGTAAATGLTGEYVPAFAINSTLSLSANYGQDATFAGNVTGANGYSQSAGGEFKYQPPAGYKALKVSNLPEPAFTPRNDSIENSFFYTVLYEGNGGGQRVGQFLPLNEVKTIDQSLRFNDDDTLSFKRTPTSAGNRQEWSLSMWIKRGSSIGSEVFLAEAGASGGSDTRLRLVINTSNQFMVTNGVANLVSSTQVLKDTSKWYHVVWWNSGGTNKVYLDGEEVASVAIAGDTAINSTVEHGFGTRGASGAGNEFDGYIAEMHFTDGTAYGPSTFAQTDPSTETWIPKTVTGVTYGTNGFHLDYADTSDYGKNIATANTFASFNTVSGFVASDQMTDTPTKNFATLDNSYAVIGASTLSEGNLKADGAGFSSTLWGGGFASIPLPSTGKYYFECQDTAATGSSWGAGVCSEQAVPTATNTGGDESITFYNRSVRLNGTENDYGASAGFGGLGDATYAAGDIMGVAVDCSTREVWFSQNGTFIDTPTTNDSGTPGDPANGNYPVGTVNLNNFEPMRFVLFGSASNMICNFGQDSSFAGQISPSANTDGSGGQFKFTPPTGFKALNVDNLPNQTRGIARRKTPVFTWIKNRDSTDSHMLFDQVRGATKVLHTDPDTAVAETTEPNTLQKFLPGGFQIGNDVQVNTAGESYVAWNWCMHDDIVNAGTVVNTDGNNINSTVLADKRLGFSIVKYTGTGLGADTVGHGLSQKPDMIINANINMDHSLDYWFVNHKDLTAADYNIFLNLTSAESDVNTNYSEGGIGLGNSSVFDFIAGYSGSNNVANCNKDGSSYISYVFHSVPGFSTFGSYTGNGSADGTYVHLGFRPALVMAKSTGVENWIVLDNKRPGYNPTGNYLYWNLANAEGGAGGEYIDLLSNGFKLKTTGASANSSGATYIYLAFAEVPFKYANAR